MSSPRGPPDYDSNESVPAGGKPAAAGDDDAKLEVPLPPPGGRADPHLGDVSSLFPCPLDKSTTPEQVMRIIRALNAERERDGTLYPFGRRIGRMLDQSRRRTERNSRRARKELGGGRGTHAEQPRPHADHAVVTVETEGAYVMVNIENEVKTEPEDLG